MFDTLTTKKKTFLSAAQSIYNCNVIQTLSRKKNFIPFQFGWASLLKTQNKSNTKIFLEK